MGIEVEVSAGELLDKISILRIKQSKIKDHDQLQNIEKELDHLLEARRKYIQLSSEMEQLYRHLRSVNQKLWEIKDRISAYDQKKSLGKNFIELARSLDVENDIRAQIKREINEIWHADMIEEKSYSTYEGFDEKNVRDR